MKVKVITGYCPIPDHPRTPKEYGELGEQLFRHLNVPVKSFYTQLPACWLYRDMFKRQFKVKHFEGDNPAKNTLDYHIVQHQKSEWLLAGAMLDETEADTFVWMDYGIAHQPGVTPAVVNDFLAKVAKDDFAIPGCWSDKSQPVEMSYINWRFCGSMLIVPRQHIHAFDSEMKRTIRRIIERTHHVTWEVNTLARLERLQTLPIRWYKADHNETQFTNYEAPDADRLVQPLHPVRDGQGAEGDERLGLQSDLLRGLQGMAA